MTKEFEERIRKIVREEIEHYFQKSNSDTRETKGEMDLELIVTKEIRKMGIPAHIKGYSYIRTALIMIMKDPSRMDFVTKRLYPEIAEKYRVKSPCNIERGIRHAIEVAFSRGNRKYLDEMFDYTIPRSQGRPTNSEFLAIVAENIKNQI